MMRRFCLGRVHLQIVSRASFGDGWRNLTELIYAKRACDGRAIAYAAARVMPLNSGAATGGWMDGDGLRPLFFALC
jgi:hypothetical protein